MEYLKDLDVTPILIGILFSVVTLYWWCSRRSYKLPPGPIGLPLVGYLPFLDKESFKSFKKLAEKYGNIFSLYLGRNLTVVLSDYKLIKDAFNQQALLNRPPHIFDFHPDGFGFVGSNGEEWLEQRRYTMKIMRDIGLGKSQWENLLAAEVEEVRDWLKTHDGKPVNIYRSLSASVSNNMTTLVFGKRLPAGDPTRILVDDNVEAVTRVFLQSGFVSFFPNLLALFAKIRFTQLGKDRKLMVQFSNFLKKQVETRKKALIAEDSEDVFIDGYLKEIKKNKQRNIENSFNEENLIGSCQAMVSAGSETTRTAILWLLLAMVTYPEVQKKVHEEIDTVLRKDGKITWKDRSKLPYVNATIMESLRWKTVAPLNLLHYNANADVVVSGYDIPKGTVVISNLWAVHNDPEYWKDPEKFIPERFLVEENGELTTTKPDGFIPFSIGRRNCPGEQVAMIEILHYFVTIMQNFQLLPEFDGKLPDLSGSLGITYQCKPQKLRFVPRD